jgi:hypothetical protein
MAGKTKLKAGCGLFMVFSAGFLCGAIALFLLLVNIIPLSEGWRDEKSKDFVAKHLANQLDLTDEQIEQARPIVYEALGQRYARRKTYIEADIEITREALEKIRPILTEKQRAKADRMFGNWKRGKKRFLLGASAEPDPESGADSNPEPEADPGTTKPQ